MKTTDPKEVLLKIYLLSRFVIKASKKYDKEKTLRFTILALLEKTPMTVRDLARLFTVNHSFMSAALAAMEKEKLIKKEISKDQRYRLVRLAPKGRELRRKIADEGYLIADVLFKNMTDQEIGHLGELIAKLNMDYEALFSKVKQDYQILQA